MPERPDIIAAQDEGIAWPHIWSPLPVISDLILGVPRREGYS